MSSRKLFSIFSNSYTITFSSFDHTIPVPNQAIQINKNWGSRSLAEAYNNRGVAKMNLGDNQEAIADYNQAIKLKPDFAHAYYSRGLSYKNLNDNQNAINDFRQAAKLYKYENNQEWYQNSLDKLKELGVPDYIFVIT
jgi:tetratricopeptide (TPR) repeat protein